MAAMKSILPGSSERLENLRSAEIMGIFLCLWRLIRSLFYSQVLSALVMIGLYFREDFLTLLYFVIEWRDMGYLFSDRSVLLVKEVGVKLDLNRDL